MNLADRTLEILDEGNAWCKMKMFDGPTACLSGSMSRAMSQVHSLESMSPIPAAFHIFSDTVREVIAEQFPDRCRPSFGTEGDIAGFNDHTDTTFDDVRLVLEKVSARLDETEL